jgi:Leucine-rich repeat (LRR) protein
MDWNNYLLENKSPGAEYAHLGVIDGTVEYIWDLSKIPKDAKIISLCSPLKKFKIKYTNYEALAGNKNIEGIILNEIDEERFSILSKLPNLKYIKISFNKQQEIADFPFLKSLEVLILANITKVSGIDFLKNLKNLKTLYIYGINNLYDLDPLRNLKSLKELSLHHGKMSETGKLVKSMEPIGELTELKYLAFALSVEGNNNDITPILKLKKLERLLILPKYLKKDQDKILVKELPLLKDWN